LTVAKTRPGPPGTAPNLSYTRETVEFREDTMNRAKFVYRTLSTAALVVACFAVSTLPVQGQDQTTAEKIPTVYRDAYEIKIKGKAEADGTFSMVFKPHGADGTEFTVNVLKKMNAKEIARDLAKELTLAAGASYKVKQNGDKVVVKRVNKKIETLALEITEQKLNGVSLMIGKK
jgi:hypothetical protein